MASVRISRLLCLALVATLLLGIFPAPAQAASGDDNYLSIGRLGLSAKSAPRVDDPITGVFAPNLFYFPVVSQSNHGFAYVSTAADTLTQFGLATQYQNVGLLAHNSLAGQQFFNLGVGQLIYLIRGQEQIEVFTVKRILRYQALDPYSPYSDFRDTETGDTISATQMFTMAYTGDYHLTFQTCIEQNGNSSWGRLFVIAEPVFFRSK